MYDMKITTTRKVPQNRMPPVDSYLTEDDLQVLYDRWGTGVTKYGWADPVSMRGGIITITVKQLKDTPVEELEKIYYPTRAKRILEAVANVVV